MKKSTWRKSLSKLVALTILMGGVGYSDCALAADHIPPGSQSGNDVKVYDDGAVARYEANTIVDFTPVTDGDCIYGGYQGSPTEPIENNTVTWNATADVNIEGGWTNTAGVDVKGNAVTISGGEISASTRGYIYGGDSNVDGVVENNTVTITGGSLGSTNKVVLYGGFGFYGAVRNNTVTINGGTFHHTSIIVGGTQDDSSTNAVEGNKVIISGGEFVGNIARIFGGYASTSTASSNSVEISSGNLTLDKYIAGGVTKTGTVKNNEVWIHGGKINGAVFGGAVTEATGGAAEGNKIKFSDSDSAAGKADITGDVFLQGRYVLGANSSLGGGTLTVYNIGNKIDGNLYADNAELNFYINPADLPGSNTMLAVSGTADVKGSKVQAGVLNVGKVNKGDQITLLNAGTLEAEGMTTAVLTDGLMNVEMDVLKDGNSIIAKIGSSSYCADYSKLPVETQAASLALVNSGADMLADKVLQSAAGVVAEENAAGNASGMSVFAAIGGGSSRLNTGSHVDMKAWNVAVGFAKEVQNKSGKFLFAPVIEYARGSYDSYLDNGAHGDGASSFFGLSLLAKQTFNNNVYLEGSVRGGRSKNDLDAFVDGKDMSYDNSANYYGAHIGVGKLVKVGKNDNIDCYGKFFWTHRNGSSATMDCGYHYDFAATNSLRTKLGFRYNHNLNEMNTLYAGLAWQHEFGSQCDAAVSSGVWSADAPAPSLKGDSGILELGWNIKSNGGRFETGLGVVGSVGKQRGIGGSLQFNWNF